MLLRVMRDAESHYTLFIQDKQYQEKWTNNHIKIYVYEPQNPERCAYNRMIAVHIRQKRSWIGVQ